MKILQAAMFLFLIFCAHGYAQTNKPTVCPTISVEGPGQLPKPNELIVFRAKIGGDISGIPITYDWSISSSQIAEGQSTDQIKVRFPGYSQGLTASVEIKGFPNGCPHTASETLNWDFPEESVLLVKYGTLSTTEENVKLGEAAEALNRDPSATMTVIIYRTTKQSARDAVAHRASIMSRLAESFGVDATRVTFVFGEADAPRTEIYLVPAGADQPKIAEATSDVSSQSCPAVSLTGPGSNLKYRDDVIFAATVSGNDQEQLKFRWSISAGTIASGQGTEIINISTDGLAGPDVTAELKIDGLPANCQNKFNETFTVGSPCGGSPIMLAEYGKLSSVREKKQFDEIAAEWTKWMDSVLVFMITLPKGVNKSLFQRRTKIIRDYFARTHRIPGDRLEFAYAGESSNRSDWTAVYQIPRKCGSVF